ncbi:hypothetical protein AAMO2058_001457300 [Amorphochlora amoebiformis]
MRQCALNVRHMPTGKRSFHTTKLREPDPESSRGGSGQFPFLVPRPRGSIKRRSTMKYEKEKNLAIRKGAAPRRRYYLPDHGNFIFNCSDSATSEIKAPDKILKENRARHLLDESRRKHDKRMARLEQTHRRACRDTQKFYAKKYGTKSERLSRMSKSRLPFQPQTQLTHRRPRTPQASLSRRSSNTLSLTFRLPPISGDPSRAAHDPRSRVSREIQTFSQTGGRVGDT